MAHSSMELAPSLWLDVAGTLFKLPQLNLRGSYVSV